MNAAISSSKGTTHTTQINVTASSEIVSAADHLLPFGLRRQTTLTKCEQPRNNNTSLRESWHLGGRENLPRIMKG
jgi:hypothetical protein